MAHTDGRKSWCTGHIRIPVVSTVASHFFSSALEFSWSTHSLACFKSRLKTSPFFAAQYHIARFTAIAATPIRMRPSAIYKFVIVIIVFYRLRQLLTNPFHRRLFLIPWSRTPRTLTRTVSSEIYRVLFLVLFLTFPYFFWFLAPYWGLFAVKRNIRKVLAWARGRGRISSSFTFRRLNLPFHGCPAKCCFKVYDALNFRMWAPKFVALYSAEQSEYMYTDIHPVVCDGFIAKHWLQFTA